MRIQSIDFLRGLAIILVLFRHVLYVPYMAEIGWAGVDLFFVLSGFLVSGLLFHEYKKYNTINAKQFLIRRAFKIYPLFWFVLIYTVAAHKLTGFGSEKGDFFAELFFYQNYHKGLLQVSWSLAVEEHFYILLIITLSLVIRFGTLTNKKAFHIGAFVVLTTCLSIRIANYFIYTDYNFVHHYAATHIRIDSLTFGVLISYNYHFNKDWLTNFITKHARKLFLLFLVCLTPILVLESTNWYIRTLGYTTTYICFGTLLLLYLLHPKTEIITQKIISKTAFEYLATIGTWSYALYLIHIPVLIFFKRLTQRMINMQARDISMLVCYLTVSLIAAYVLTELIEKPFLKLRDRYFPNKRKQVERERFMEAMPI